MPLGDRVGVRRLVDRDHPATEGRATVVARMVAVEARCRFCSSSSPSCARRISKDEIGSSRVTERFGRANEIGHDSCGRGFLDPS
jgi:hypothetical protein